jgi:Tol biopolymer transport system component
LYFYLKRVTQFGERADWSHDGKKILFVEKTYGDVYEIELATGKIFLLTGQKPPMRLDMEYLLWI